MNRFKDAEHLVRVAGVFLLGITLFLCFRAWFVPKSFGQYGHYRADSITEIAALPVIHAGHETCETCHADVLEIKKAGKHAGVNCEACHGPQGKHAEDPSSIKPALPDTAVAAGAPASRFLNLRSWLLTMGAGAAGFVLGRWLEGILGPSAPFLAAVVIGSLPRMARANSRDKKLAAMEEQFPDALEFLSRSVRAGNAFSVGLELLAGEIGDPLKPEFLKLTREMALGAGLEEALYRLIGRVPLPEVRFFVAAVLLQRETGGNLGEVLGKLAVSVRERMQLRGKVRAASGQGRLTARVLTCLPVATMILLKLLSPAYIDAMTDSPVGRNLLAAAVVSQLLGYLAMQRIIRIEV